MSNRTQILWEERAWYKNALSLFKLMIRFAAVFGAVFSTLTYVDRVPTLRRQAELMERKIDKEVTLRRIIMKDQFLYKHDSAGLVDGDKLIYRDLPEDTLQYVKP